MHVDWTTTLMSFLGFAMGGGAFVRVLFLKPHVPARSTAHLKEEKLVKIMYVLGDMRGRSYQELDDAVARSSSQYVNLLKLGIYPVSIGVNTPYNLRDFAHPAMFEEAGKELISRCDGVLLLQGHEDSPEASAVLEHAKVCKKSLFDVTEGHLREKLKTWATLED